MPTFMDRHDVKGLSTADILGAHERDLVLQEQHNVNFLTYWYDDAQGLVFCLAHAPTAGALKELHAQAHGNIPGDIMEVDLDDVRAFLGRTTDPESGETAGVEVPFTVVTDSPFRVIMFTDLQHSTAMTVALGDRRAVELLTIHDEITRDTVGANGGAVVKHTGDGFMCAFPTVAESVRTAIVLQQAFARHNELNPDQQLHVRVGLNAGYPVEHNQDLFGLTVNMAARVVDRAEPDQILATGIIRELCEDPPLKATFRDAGRATMKGFPSAVQLVEIKWQ